MVENKVKERRLELGMTLAQLSEASGVPISTLSEIEEKGREPRVLTAVHIARALMRDVDELWPM